MHSLTKLPMSVNVDKILKLKSSLSPFSSQKGFVLTVTLIFLVVVLIIVIAFLDMIRAHLTSTTYRANREKGVYLAEAGAEQKLLELKLDLINSASNIYDAFNETWASGIGDTNGSLNDSEGVSLDSGKYQVLKGFIDGATPPDTFQNLSDEQGKININYANTLLLTNLFTLVGIASPSTKAQNVYNYKYGTDGLPGISGDDDGDNGDNLFPNGIDNDRLNGDDADEEFLGIEYNGLDEDGDGNGGTASVPDTGEGIDEPDEFDPTNPKGDDRPYYTIEDIKKTGLTDAEFQLIKAHITVSSIATVNDLYANDFSVSNNYKVPYAPTPKITRSAIPRAPVNVNTASLIVLKAIIYAGGTDITQANAEAVAREIINQRNGPDNLHGTNDDNPFDTRAELNSAIDGVSSPGLTGGDKDKIKDNADPSTTVYCSGCNSYTTEFTFTTKAVKITSQGQITGTGGTKSVPELNIMVEK